VEEGGHQTLSLSAIGLAPSGRIRFGFGAKPLLAETFRHVDFCIVELPWQMIDAARPSGLHCP
jgi:hypothetical protein